MSTNNKQYISFDMRFQENPSTTLRRRLPTICFARSHNGEKSFLKFPGSA